MEFEEGVSLTSRVRRISVADTSRVAPHWRRVRSSRLTTAGDSTLQPNTFAKVPGERFISVVMAPNTTDDGKACVRDRRRSTVRADSPGCRQLHIADRTAGR